MTANDFMTELKYRATGDPMTRDHHYSDHLSQYVSPQPRIEPALKACHGSMSPTRPSRAKILNIRIGMGCMLLQYYILITNPSISTHLCITENIQDVQLEGCFH